jgi:shikimate 5-dehydrogenase
MEDIKELLTLMSDLKKKGLTGGSVTMPFCRRLIQPIKDRVHPMYEY